MWVIQQLVFKNPPSLIPDLKHLFVSQIQVADSMLTFFLERLGGDFGSILPCIRAIRSMLQNQTSALFPHSHSTSKSTEDVEKNENKLRNLLDKLFGKLPDDVLDQLKPFDADEVIQPSPPSATNSLDDRVPVHWSGCSQPIRQQIFGIFEDFMQVFKHIHHVNCNHGCGGGGEEDLGATKKEKKKGFNLKLSLFCERMFHPFIEIFEGEKDPRVLMTALNMTVLLQSAMGPVSFVDVGTTAEGGGVGRKRVLADGREFGDALVEVLGMYFPITFNPPPGDPHGITKVCLSKHVHGHLLIFYWFRFEICLYKSINLLCG
jgi:hypothetical protein